MKYSEMKAAKGAETPEARERIDAIKGEMRLAEAKVRIKELEGLLRHETLNRKGCTHRKRVGEAIAKRGLSENACIALYMVAGPLLVPPHDYSEGQAKRLGSLILDVLSEPHRYGARLIRDLGREAVEP